MRRAANASNDVLLRAHYECIVDNLCRGHAVRTAVFLYFAIFVCVPEINIFSDNTSRR